MLYSHYLESNYVSHGNDVRWIRTTFPNLPGQHRMEIHSNGISLDHSIHETEHNETDVILRNLVYSTGHSRTRTRAKHDKISSNNHAYQWEVGMDRARLREDSNVGMRYWNAVELFVVTAEKRISGKTEEVQAI